MICFEINTLLTVMLCTTLKPNGKFCTNCKNIEGIEPLECICTCFLNSHLSCLAIFIILDSNLHSLQSSHLQKGLASVTVKIYLKKKLVLVSQEIVLKESLKSMFASLFNDASVKHTLGCLWYVLQKIRRH